VIEEHRDLLESIAVALLDRETIDREMIDRLQAGETLPPMPPPSGVEPATGVVAANGEAGDVEEPAGGEEGVAELSPVPSREVEAPAARAGGVNSGSEAAP
jgi:hypothetical protein